MSIKGSFGGLLTTAILASIASYLITYDFRVSLCVMLISIVFGLCATISYLPIVGTIISYMLLMRSWDYLIVMFDVPDSVFGILSIVWWVYWILGCLISLVVLISILFIIISK